MRLASNRFAFLTAVLKAREAKGVDRDTLEELILRAGSMAEAVDFMKDTDLGGFLAEYGAASFDEMDDLLWKYLGRYFGRIRNLRPDPSVIRLIERYLHRYDVANIISALRAAVFQRPAHMIPVGTLFDQGLLNDLSRVQSPGEAVSVIVMGGMAEYAEPIRRTTEIDRRSLRQVERGLDQLYLQKLRETLQDMDDHEILLRAQGIILDYQILGMILRAAGSGGVSAVDGGGAVSGGYLLTPDMVREFAGLKVAEIAAMLEETPYHAMVQEIARQIEQQGAYVIDRIMDSDLIMRIRELLSPRPLSPCAVLWHLIFKEYEVRSVRVALKAMEDRLPPGEVKDYLVVGL